MIEEVIDPARSVAKPRELLLQIDVEAAEKHGCGGAGGGFVQRERQVHGEQDGVVSCCNEVFREGVIAHANAAVVAAGPGGEEEQAHAGAG